MFSVLFVMIAFSFVLSVAAIGGSISERSGIINLSIEGFMTIGAISYAMIVGSKQLINSSEINQFWIMPLAALITSLIGATYATITVKLKANQTIAGIALNILALSISLFLIHSKINPQTTALQAEDKIRIYNQAWQMGSNDTKLISSFINVVTLIGTITIIGLIVLFNKTKLGIKIKSCGEEPSAAETLGINVGKTQFIAVILASVISGLAGAMFAQIKFIYFFGSTQGFGFLAVAIVIFGQWRPSFMILGSILFGFLYGLVFKIVLVPGLNQLEYADLLQAIPYLVSIIVLVFTQKKSKAPKYLGIPYKNAGR